jgi:hypothetical protein
MSNMVEVGTDERGSNYFSGGLQRLAGILIA